MVTNLKTRLFVSTEYANEMDGQTDGQTYRQTRRDGIGRACAYAERRAAEWCLTNVLSGKRLLGK